jgi:hypothetical protein
MLANFNIPQMDKGSKCVEKSAESALRVQWRIVVADEVPGHSRAEEWPAYLERGRHEKRVQGFAI